MDLNPNPSGSLLLFLGRELIGRKAYKYSLRNLALAVGGFNAMAAGESGDPSGFGSDFSGLFFCK